MGVLKPDEEEWRGVVGKHGLDERNEAGEEFLEFCALNQLIPGSRRGTSAMTLGCIQP